MSRKISNIVKVVLIAFFLIALGTVSVIYIKRLNNEKQIDRPAPVESIEEINVSLSEMSEESATEENKSEVSEVVDDEVEVDVEEEEAFPILVDAPQIDVTIYDYYFTDEVPQLDGVDMLAECEKYGYTSLVDENGEFNNSCIFMVMDYKVTSKMDTELFYGANNAYIYHYDEADFEKTGPWIRATEEMIYFSAKQTEGEMCMFYTFEPNGEYEATCVFAIRCLDEFSDLERECLLVFGNGYNQLMEDDRVVYLDKTRRK